MTTLEMRCFCSRKGEPSVAYTGKDSLMWDFYRVPRPQQTWVRRGWLASAPHMTHCIFAEEKYFVAYSQMEMLCTL